MEPLPADFVAAVAAGRFGEAAADRQLVARARGQGDALAEALLAVASAHREAREGRAEGARSDIGRAVRLLEALPLDPYAALLIEHCRQLMRALQEGGDPPSFPLGFR